MKKEYLSVRGTNTVTINVPPGFALRILTAIGVITGADANGDSLILQVLQPAAGRTIHKSIVPTIGDTAYNVCFGIGLEVTQAPLISTTVATGVANYYAPSELMGPIADIPITQTVNVSITGDVSASCGTLDVFYELAELTVSRARGRA